MLAWQQLPANWLSIHDSHAFPGGHPSGCGCVMLGRWRRRSPTDASPSTKAKCHFRGNQRKREPPAAPMLLSDVETASQARSHPASCHTLGCRNGDNRTATADLTPPESPERPERGNLSCRRTSFWTFWTSWG